MPLVPTDSATPVFTTPAAAPRWRRWLIYSPLARIVWFVAMLVVFSIAIRSAVGVPGWTAKNAPASLHALAQMCAQIIPALVAYLILVRLIERRAVTELAPRRLVPHGVAGLLAGTIFFSTVVAVLWLLGSYHVIGTQHPDWLPALLVAGLGAGIGEEIVFRGVLFRVVEEGLGTWWALAISALFFGAGHIGNPGATLWSSMAIAIEAGLLFGIMYHLTRSLYLCMGVHAAWNLMQGTVYGIPVSGTKADGFLLSTRSGPDWLSGGVFGAEASVVAVVLSLLVSTALFAIALHQRSLVKPGWRRPRNMSDPLVAASILS